MDERFGSDCRLRKRSEYERVYRHGQRRSTAVVAVILSRSAAEGCGRLGISIGRRVGSAVVRNRLKRQLRELYRRRLRSKVRDLDLVVQVRPVAVGKSLQELEMYLCRAIRGQIRRSTARSELSG